MNQEKLKFVWNWEANPRKTIAAEKKPAINNNKNKQKNVTEQDKTFLKQAK